MGPTMTARKKVLHIITRLDRGGSPAVVFDLCENLSGYDHVLVSGPSCVGNEGRVGTLKARHIIVPALQREINPLKDFAAWRQLVRIVRSEKPDIVHAHTSKAGFLGRAAARWRRVPRVVYSTHGHVFYGYYGRACSMAIRTLERIAARWADRIVVLTKRGADEHVRLRICPREKLAVTPNGIDLARFSAQFDAAEFRRRNGIPSGTEFLIVVVARLAEVKGVDVFVNAVSRLPEEWRARVYCVVAGDGPEHAALSELVVARGLKGIVRLAGHSEEADKWLLSADLAVQPSRNEGFGIAALEAMAAGTPVVATKVGGLPDLLGDCAVLVPSDDAAALAQAIVAALGDADRRADMSACGKARAKSFSLEAMREHYEKLYEELLREP